MKKILLAVSFGFMAMATQAQMAIPKPPVDGYKYVQIEDADHDFGNIVYGKPTTYQVVMKNISNDTLALTNVDVSCGCTTPQYKPGLYPPGAEIQMTVGYSGLTEGPFHKTMRALFQDSKVGLIVKTLRFHGTGIKK